MKNQTEKKAQAPTQIELSREEHLDLENIQLRMEAAQRTMQDLLVRRGSVTDAIAKQHGVDLNGWIINLQQGTIAKPPPPVQVVPDKPSQAS